MKQKHPTFGVDYKSVIQGISITLFSLFTSLVTVYSMANGFAHVIPSAICWLALPFLCSTVAVSIVNKKTMAAIPAKRARIVPNLVGIIATSICASAVLILDLVKGESWHVDLGLINPDSNSILHTARKTIFYFPTTMTAAAFFAVVLSLNIFWEMSIDAIWKFDNKKESAFLYDSRTSESLSEREPVLTPTRQEG